MINKNTLKKLNKLGFGADIDSLESYIIDFKQARNVSNLSIYESNYLKLYKILKELKPESKAFSEDVELVELELDNNDELFDKYPNFNNEIAYGINSIAVNNVISNIDDCEDIVAIPNIDGLDIKCSYMMGYLYRVYLIGETNKYIDITKYVKNDLPYSIPKLSKYRLAELRGKLTITNDKERLQTKSLNIPCSIMRFIRTQTYTNEFVLFFDDLVINKDEYVDLPYSNQWEKLEFMEELGVNVTQHALIRSIDSETFKNALTDLDKYFIELEDINYKYNGIKVKFNRLDAENSVCTSLIYNSTHCEQNQRFTSTVKSVGTVFKDDMVQQLKIVKVQCNDRLFIDSIEIDDIYKLEINNVSIGSKVNFQVIEGKAYLI